MTQDIAIRVQGLSKCYQIYDNPSDRLKQFIYPRVKQFLGKQHSAYFREFWALQDVSFEVKRGETVGIIGRNGSGKSTLLQIICGTLTPTHGEVQTNGRIAALLELGSGFKPEFTGRENVYLNAAVLGLTKEEVDARFDQIAVFADIGQFMEQAVKTYLSGMMVRLAFAVIAHVNADILVIDEALAVGDVFFNQKCMHFLREFMVHGTILFVSHDTASVKSLCNTAAWLDKGNLLQLGSPKDVSEMYLEAFYEEQQGKNKAQVLNNKTSTQHIKKSNSIGVVKDPRQAFLNASNLRNDLKVFEFIQDSAAFGNAATQIEFVELHDETNARLNWVVSGEKITLQISVKVYQYLGSPIISFFIKDRLGQILFGDNTYISYTDKLQSCQADGNLEAAFIFQMPYFSLGDYSIAVAVANGSQDVHEQHHWMHDALMFKSVASNVAAGLVGLPMLEISLLSADN